MLRWIVGSLAFGMATLSGCVGDAPVPATVSDAGTSGTGGASPLAFVTKGTYNGRLGQTGGGAEAADATCAAEAAAAGAAGRTFRALISVGGANALARVPNGPWTMSRGEAVRAKAAWGDSNIVLINRSADGTVVGPGELVWTGSDDSGKEYPGETCANWTDDGTGSQKGHLGEVGATGSGEWLSKTSGACEEKRHIYCFEAN